MEQISSFYIHIPFCISKCKYCDFFSTTKFSEEIFDLYLVSLINEIKYRTNFYNVQKLQTIYIGGGTPSLLNSKQVHKLFEFLRSNFQFAQNIEITIEANPDDLTPTLLQCYKNEGINRISCGIQSLNENALCFASRRASVEKNIFALELLKREWSGKLSLDLICGLPRETEETFIKGLRKIIEYNPDHISLYSLTIEDNTPFGKYLDSGLLKYDFDFADKLWLEGRKILIQNHYNQYEISNFSKKGMECRHNLTYWNHENYIGSGSGATGTVYLENGSAIRWTNTKNVDEYINFWKNSDLIEENTVKITVPEEIENVNKEDSIFEFFMMGLRKATGVNSLQFERKFNEKIPEKIMNVFKKWEKRGLCQITQTNAGTNYSLGQKGILFLNKFLEEIL